MEICSKLESIENIGPFYLLHTNCLDIKIYFLTNEIVRVRAAFDRKFDEESYVLSLTAWEDRLDFIFSEERKRIEPIEPEFCETNNEITLSTNKITLKINKDPIAIKVYDEEGCLLHSDLDGNPYVLDSNNRINHYSLIDENDHYYGFGEKPGPSIDKSKEYMKLSAKDAMGYDPLCIDSLYKHIPFYIKLNKKPMGVFYHNFNESSFNMGKEKSNYWPYYSVWQADGGDIDIFYVGGKNIKEVLNNYTLLTGKPALLPKRALGYQGSSMFYAELEENCDDAILEFIDTVKDEGVPIDGFHLSSGYTNYNNKRCVFTWDKKRFKNPDKYFEESNIRGAQNVPNVKPGVLLEHPYFEKFNSYNVFVKNSKNIETYAIGKWWGGDGAFWDFTNEKSRNIWKEYLKKNIIELGTNSIWNDNCEYDSLMDKDAICYFDGKLGTIGELKPIMSTLMSKLSYDAVKENDNNARPYVVCRSGSAGIQKYAQTWCGDNFTSWDSLKYNISTILGMSLSGCPNEGSDIGGFYGPAPSEELFLRWVQHGIFQARFSIHSTNWDNTVTEPWMYSNIKEKIKDAIKLRYRLLPYLYSAMYEATLTGAPIMRPLVYEFENDKNVLKESVNFLFGKDILIANIVEEKANKKEVYFPIGQKWYDFWTFETYEGGIKEEIDVTIDDIPMFIRQGAIIPISKNQLMNMENDKIIDLKLILSPFNISEYVLYDDDGKSNDYENGLYSKTNIKMVQNEITTIDFVYEGDYKNSIEKILIEMIAKDKSPYWIKLNGEKIEHYLNRNKFEYAETGWYYSQTKKAVLIKYFKPKNDYKIEVSFEEFDMIGM